MAQGSLEELAERLFALQRAVWRAEWDLRDACLVAVRTLDDGQIREVAAAWDVSHRWIYSLAVLAKHFPEEKRCADKSVRTHSAWRNKDLAL